MPWLECVPNVSEGRSAPTIDRLVEALRPEALWTGDPTVQLLHRTSDPDHHRSVFTLAGPSEALHDALLRLAAAAIETIDLRDHRGVHPRVGALDVVPVVPLAGLAPDGGTLDDADRLARTVGSAIAERHDVPVWFYGRSASRQATRSLADLRRGGLEGLARRLADGLVPDAGPPRLHPTAGAVVCGARELLVAYNVLLDSDDLRLARVIARAVREADGGLPGVRALGLRLDHLGRVQVSMNLTTPGASGLHAAFDTVSRHAGDAGVAVAGSELIGLAPSLAFAGRPLEELHLVELDGGTIRPVDDLDRFRRERVLEARLRAVSPAAVSPEGPRRDDAAGRRTIPTTS